MFSTPGSLKKRTGKGDLNRLDYLKELSQEYKSPNISIDKKEQVLANLANFAYDPINFEYFRRLDIIDLFLENLKFFQSTKNLKFKILNFSVAAICNLCLDPKNRNHLLQNNLINLILNCLSIEPTAENIELILNVLTILIFFTEINEAQSETCLVDVLKPIKDQILCYKNEKINFKSLIYEYSRSSNKRLSNLAFILMKNVDLS